MIYQILKIIREVGRDGKYLEWLCKKHKEENPVLMRREDIESIKCLLLF